MTTMTRIKKKKKRQQTNADVAEDDDNYDVAYKKGLNNSVCTKVAKKK